MPGFGPRHEETAGTGSLAHFRYWKNKNTYPVHIIDENVTRIRNESCIRYLPYFSVLRIRDILVRIRIRTSEVRIRIRIRIRILLFSSVTFKMATKICFAFHQGCGSGSGSGFNRVCGSESRFEIRIRIQEGKNDPQK